MTKDAATSDTPQRYTMWCRASHRHEPLDDPNGAFVLWIYYAKLQRELAAAREVANRETLSAAYWKDKAEAAQRDAEHWKKMYECAQNANAYRQDALDSAKEEL